MHNRKFTLVGVLAIAAIVSACAQPSNTSEVATLQAQLAAAKAGSGSDSDNATKVAQLQAQLDAAQSGSSNSNLPAFNPTFKNPDTLTYQTIGDPETIDPAFDYENVGQGDILSFYDTLLFFKDSSVTDFAPMLAEKWDVSSDGKAYTFTIRKGVTFHDGAALTPSDVAYTFQRDVLTGWGSDLGGPQSLILQPVFGVGTIDELSKKAGGDQQACEAVKKAFAADETAGTFTMTLVEPSSYVLQVMAANDYGAIQNEKFVQSKGGWDGDCKTWRSFIPTDISKTPLFNVEDGTGPYKLDHWTPNDELVLTRNDSWWVKAPLYEGSTVAGLPQIKTIVNKNVTEWSTRLAALQTGDADIIDVTSAYYEQIDPMVKEYIEGPAAKADGSNVTIKNPNGSLRMWHGIALPGSTDLQFNQKIDISGGNPLVGSGKMDGQGIPPDFFSDIHVRRAFNYCFDTDTYIKEVAQGEALPRRGPIIAGLPGYDANSPILSYDLDKCAAELNQAFNGEVGQKGFTLTLAYNSGNDNRRIALEILRDGLLAANAKASGGDRNKQNISIAIAALAWPAFLDARSKGRLPVNINGWIEDFHDSYNWVHPFMACNGDYSAAQGLPQDVCSKWDDMMNKALTSTDPKESAQIYTELQKEAIDQAIDIFIDQGQSRWYQQMWLDGWVYRPLVATPYWAGMSKNAPK